MEKDKEEIIEDKNWENFSLIDLILIAFLLGFGGDNKNNDKNP